MTKTEYAEYTRSEHWQQRRKQAIISAGHKCECCDLPRWIARLVYDQDLHVHHRNYIRLGNEKQDDLEALCRRCHEVETFGRSNFAEPKTTTCSLCGGTHWDVYADYCEECRIVFSRGVEPLFLRLEAKDENGEAAWWSLLYDAMAYRTPTIVAFLERTLRVKIPHFKKSAQ